MTTSIAKGNKVAIPILQAHRSKEIWGEDVLEFKYVNPRFPWIRYNAFITHVDSRPERWDQPPESISAIPGVWGHLLTFIGGPRACIGYRFSLVEYVHSSRCLLVAHILIFDHRLKALLFALVRSFEFEFAVPVEDICVKTAPLQRPSLRSAPQGGFQLPLLVKPYKAA